MTQAQTEPRPRERFGCFAPGVLLIAGLAVAKWWSAAIGLPIAVAAAAILVHLLRRESAVTDAYRKRRLERWGSITPPGGQAWRLLLPAEGFGDLVSAIEPHVRPAVRLTSRPGEAAALGQSRIGGEPDLPKALSWPKTGRQSVPFIAQIDLKEIASVLSESPLPHAGHLWFFSDGSETGIVLHDASDAPRQATPTPEDVPKTWRFACCPLALEAYQALPEVSVVEALDAITSDDEEKLESYTEIQSYISGETTMGNVHTLLGWPEAIQDPAELNEPATRLLLQVESDKGAGMMWGDAGRLYFCIKNEDLRAARFDAVSMKFQCY